MMTIMDKVIFTKTKLNKLKAAYAKAKLEGKDQFEFEGKIILTDYAKYMIEYLERVLK